MATYREWHKSRGCHLVRGLWTVLQPKQFFPHTFSPPESLRTLSAVLLSQAHGLSHTSSYTVWLFCSEMELPGCHLAEERGGARGRRGARRGEGGEGKEGYEDINDSGKSITLREKLDSSIPLSILNFILLWRGRSERVEGVLGCME